MSIYFDFAFLLFLWQLLLCFRTLKFQQSYQSIYPTNILHFHSKNKQRVQYYIQHPAEGHADAGDPCISLCADNVCQDHIQYGGKAADHNSPEKIIPGVGERSGICSEQGEELPVKGQARYGIAKGHAPYRP